MMHRIILIAISLAAPLVLHARPAHEVCDPRILSFEESSEPMRASKGSEVGLSDLHYKHGTRSVRWQWKRDGASVRIAAPVEYLAKNPNPKETSVSTFLFWVYSAAPQEGSLRFEFRKEGRTCSWFDYRLGFSGWRGAWVAFDRDMEGTPEEGMDEIVVTVHGARRGELFFDHIVPASFQDIRHHTADFQAPFINAGTKSHWLVLLDSWNEPLPESASAPDASAFEEMRTVESRLCEYLLDGKRPATLQSLRDDFAAYGIVENPDGTLRGKPVWFVRYAEAYINLGHKDAAGMFNANGQTLRQCNDFLFRLAVAFRKAADPAERDEIARMYLLLTRHLLDQGFDAGSAQGTLHHLGYSMRNFYTAPVLMRDVLRAAGLDTRVQRAMEWFSGVGEVKSVPAAPGMDIDAFNTSLTGRLASILMLPDTPGKAVWMECFSRWVDNGYKLTEGLGPCFKSDGTVFHHCKHYPAYAVDGFSGGAVNAVWWLSKTRFKVSPESHAILRRALLEMRFYCNLRSFPLALSGRHPDGRGALVPWHYARLASAGSPDGSEEVDREMAAAYLRLANREDSFTRRFRALGIEAEHSPEGFRTYPYNASASHRRGDWLLTVAGHSRYLWSAEIYNGCNHYGRYLTHGSLQLLSDGDPVGSFGSGFRQEGWDWRHIPGTTALAIPMERMKADIRNVDTFSGYEEMLLSDETFCGGASHRGMQGAFGMKLHEHDKYNGSLRARKSWFFFDDRVVCLGSDIENAAEGGLHTTLFQNFIGDRPTATVIDGAAVSEFPFSTSVEGGCTLRDRFGNAYFVRGGRTSVRRERQHSLHEETDAPTENDFETAWIDHGDGKVSDGRYEYMIAVHADSARTAEYAARRPYEVCSADRTLHAVRDLGSGTYAAVAFEAAADMPGSDLVAAVSAPCVLLSSRGADGTATLSIADPDLRLYEGESDERFDADGKRIERSIYSRDWTGNASSAATLTVRLNGSWRPAGESAACRVAGVERTDRGTDTVLTFTCREGATIEVKLIPTDI